MLQNFSTRSKHTLKVLNDHRFVSDIINYEGPLLCLYRSEHHQDFFYKWCDSFGSLNRWMIFPINREDIKNYICKNLSLLNIVKNSSDYFLLDVQTLEGQIKYKNFWKLSPHEVPAEYFPLEDSFFDKKTQNCQKNGCRAYIFDV